MSFWAANTEKSTCKSKCFFQRCVLQAECDEHFVRDVSFGSEVCLRHVLRNTSHHCERSKQYHYVKHNTTLAQPKLNYIFICTNDYIFRSKHDCTCDLMHLFLYPKGLINLKFYLIDLNFYLCIDKNIYLWYNNVNSFVKKQGKGILYEILLYYKSHCGQGRFC